MRARGLRASFVTVVSVTLLLTGARSPAWAGDGDSASNQVVEPVPSADGGSASVDLRVEEPGTEVAAGARSDPRPSDEPAPGCSYAIVDWSTARLDQPPLSQWLITPSLHERLATRSGPHGVMVCGSYRAGSDSSAGGGSGSGPVTTWALADTPPQAFVDNLVAQARASVELPVQIGQAVPYGDEEEPLITQLPTWLWVEEEVWQPVSATTVPVLGYTATVTATPVNVVFSGAGEAVSCGPNLGRAPDPAAPDAEPPCALTYRHSSAVGDWGLTSTITWFVTYVCEPGCGSGSLPALIISNTRSVRVAELQAVVVPSGSAR